MYVEMLTSTTSTLVINDLSVTDAGRYSCVLGTVTATLTISVNGKLRF